MPRSSQPPACFGLLHQWRRVNGFCSSEHQQNAFADGDPRCKSADCLMATSPAGDYSARLDHGRIAVPAAMPIRLVWADTLSAALGRAQPGPAADLLRLRQREPADRVRRGGARRSERRLITKGNVPRRSSTASLGTISETALQRRVVGHLWVYDEDAARANAERAVKQTPKR
jgi:hypothetical protein